MGPSTMDFILLQQPKSKRAKKDDWVDPEVEFTRKKDKMESNFTLLMIVWEM